MPRNWIEFTKEEGCPYTVDDFKQALYQLVTSQVLYSRFRDQSVSYRLISDYRKEFAEAADLMGLTLIFKDDLQYCLVRQESTKARPMDLSETRFLLTLRKLYHTIASRGETNPLGEAFVSIEEFESTYKELTSHELMKNGKELRDLLTMTRSMGLAALDKDNLAPSDPQPFCIGILPAIVDGFSVEAIDRFGASLKASLVGKEPLDQTIELDTDGNDESTD